MIDSDAQSAEPAEARLPFVFGELSLTNEDDEGVGHLHWPQRRQGLWEGLSGVRGLTESPFSDSESPFPLRQSKTTLASL